MTYTVEWQEDILILEFSDPVDITEIRDANEHWKSLSKDTLVKGQAWDFSQTDVSKIIPSDIQDPHIFKDIKNMNLALISKDEHAQKAFNFYINIAKKQKANWNISIHSDLQSGLVWLASIL